jgi:hypothetical protein
MNEMRYPLRALWAEYARAAIGVGVVAVPLFTASLGTTVKVILIGLLAIFLGYGIRAALRHATRYGSDDRGVFASGPISRAIEWNDVVNVKLSYYTTKRDGTSGWWQLDIKGRRSTMRIDSTLDGFGVIAERAVREARTRGIELSPTTIENVESLEIELPDGRS